MGERVIILYSGGADSRLMLELAGESGMIPYAVLIDYGQKHVKELLTAQRHLEFMDVHYQVVKIEGLDIDSSLTGSGVGDYGDHVSVWHVPGRNSIFAGIALSIAENLKASKVWIGCDYSDRLNLFPDCYQEFVVQMDKAYSVASSSPIRFEAPLLGLTKETIYALLSNRGIEKEELFSGYGDVGVEH